MCSGKIEEGDVEVSVEEFLVEVLRRFVAIAAFASLYRTRLKSKF